MKTPLPEKPRDFNQADFLENIDELAVTVAEIITYLAELTEVVEGKQDAITIESTYPIHRGGSFGTSGTSQTTPTLKEQLLGEVRKKKVFLEFQGEEIIPMKDLEAIINKLIP